MGKTRRILNIVKVQRRRELGKRERESGGKEREGGREEKEKGNLADLVEACLVNAVENP